MIQIRSKGNSQGDEEKDRQDISFAPDLQSSQSRLEQDKTLPEEYLQEKGKGFKNGFNG